MVSCILGLAGTCLLFFGYDAAVMSLVNINPDYLQHMDSAGDTNRDAARVGGIVSFWFLGFLIGTYYHLTTPCRPSFLRSTCLRPRKQFLKIGLGGVFLVHLEKTLSLDQGC